MYMCFISTILKMKLRLKQTSRLTDGFQDELLLNKQVKRVRVSLPAKSNARMSTSCAIPASSLALFATKTERVNVNAMLSVTDARI